MRFSLCMIVKNESALLGECLDSIKDVMDEIIIVDTGSTDNTKDIAFKYTDSVYDFEWRDDFAAARNFAFSKASCDYIYSADADELIDGENLAKLKQLKDALLPEVEIVQMVYVTTKKNHPTENFERDLRPKLFKRVRGFTWIEPVHETVNLNPVVYDSDIEIIHRPVGDHSGRDFATFEKAIARDGGLSTRLLNMYLRELYKAGGEGDLERGFDFLSETLGARRTLEDKDELTCRRLIAVLMKCCRLRDDMVGLLKYSLSPEATVPSSEICMELGYFFYGKGDYIEASEWFYRAAYSCEPDMDIGSGDVKAFSALAECYGKLGDTEKAMEYKKMSGD